MQIIRHSLILSVLLSTFAACAGNAAESDTALDREAVATALRKAVTFFQDEVSIEGGHLWQYSADLKYRAGEVEATATMAWVQPPGTPSIGQALLEVYDLTGDEFYRDAARRTAHALVRGQLQSGGWDYRIEFDPKLRTKYAYRADNRTTGSNVTTLDDNTTQSALRFLMAVDRTLEFKDEAIHDSALFALKSLQKAQYPNGAWPQRYSEFPDPAKYPVKRANYPESWSREFPKPDYRGYYTFNDNSIADTIAMMFDAAATYGDETYRESAERAGEFILLAQMPEPQPAWAQQYNADMQPAWARKFEPPSITGGESQGILRTLMMLYRETGDEKYLKPIPSAIAYLKRSALPDGRLARFYELKTNRPLYFTKQYELVYTADDLPTHYGFIVSSKVDSLQREYEKLKQSVPSPATARSATQRPTIRMTSSLESDARSVVAALDSRGAWVESGELKAVKDADNVNRIIDTRTFANRIVTLARYLAASRP